MSATNNILAIIQKEWRHYFGGPIGYVMFFVWLMLFGLFFYAGLGWFVERSMRMSMGMGGGLSINDQLIGPVLGNATVAVIFIAPMMTMRLFAEEKRQGTIELLGTLPVTDLQIVLGKFLAALAVYAGMIAASLLNLLFIWAYTTPTPEWKPLLSAVLALLLFGSSYIALGTFLSTLTRNQVVAGVLSFCLFLGLFILGWFTGSDTMGGAWKEVIGYLSVTKHLDQLLKGVIDLKDVVFYLSLTTFGLVLAHQSLASQRWRA